MFGKTEFTTAVTPGAKDVIALQWKEGSQDVFASLGDDGAFVDDGYAERPQPVGRVVDPRHVRHRQDAHVRA